MTKVEIIQELLDTNSSITNDINMKLGDLSEKSNKFSSENDKVHSKLQHYEKFFSHLLTRIIHLECTAVIDSQYSRREATASNPVPANTKDVLEENICKSSLLTEVSTLYLAFSNLVNIKLTEHGKYTENISCN